jgi:nucleoid-associated protein YgaU
MTSKQSPPQSFLNLFREIVYDKTQEAKPSLDIWDSYVINNFNKKDVRNIFLHQVVPNDTWVGLALRYYGDERLWWVIPMFNDIENPFIAMNSTVASEEIERLQILKPEKINELLMISRQNKIIADREKERLRREGIEDDQ